MFISDERAAGLKAWIIKKLEDISDADSDVLADYVLALLRSESSEGQQHGKEEQSGRAALRARVVENLEDFLKSNTASFVDELLRYVSPQTQPAPPPRALDAKAAQFVPPAAAQNSINRIPLPARPEHNAAPISNNPRKRSRTAAHDPSPSPVSKTVPGRIHRQAKQLRSGDAGTGRTTTSRTAQMPMSMPMPGPGLPFQLPPSFDPQQAAAAAFTLQAMGIQLPPLFPEHMVPPLPLPAGRRATRSKGRGYCRDYETKGICHRGAKCPYLHDANQIIVPPPIPLSEEYDPNSPTIPPNAVSLSPPTNVRDRSSSGNSHHHRGGASLTQTARRDLSELSQRGPNYDRNRTTLVVEQIPDNYLTNEAVSAHFSAFGPITEITVHPEWSLATVQFSDYHSAKAAYDSPKVIFDNRFVKVFWQRQPLPDKTDNPVSSSAGNQEPNFDPEAFARTLAEAQERQERRKALKLENDTKLADLARQREELETKRVQEQRRLAEAIRARGGSPDQNETGNSATEKLRAQLKALEAEAESLGLDPEPWAPSSYAGRGRGRAGYRGRGGASRGFAGRGAAAAQPRGLPRGGAYNLDNRPKTVLVECTEGPLEDGRDEALRQYLFTIDQFTTIESSSNDNPANESDAMHSTAQRKITFKDRAAAERFFYGPRTLPGIGSMEMSWIRPAPETTSVSNGHTTAPPGTRDAERGSGKTNGRGMTTGGAGNGIGNGTGKGTGSGSGSAVHDGGDHDVDAAEEHEDGEISEDGDADGNVNAHEGYTERERELDYDVAEDDHARWA